MTQETHPHKDIIIAWLNGEDVQIYSSVTKTWQPYHAGWIIGQPWPKFSPRFQFRIAPKNVQVRHGFTPLGGLITVTRNFSPAHDEHTNYTLTHYTEIDWLTDWIDRPELNKHSPYHTGTADQE
jgi:hypothetical protein